MFSKTRMMVGFAAATIAMTAVTFPASATVVWEDDFDYVASIDDPNGLPGTNFSSVTTGGSGRVIVRANGPFAGGAGNEAYAQFKTTNGDGGLRVATADLSSSMTDAVSTFSFDFYDIAVV